MTVNRRGLSGAVVGVVCLLLGAAPAAAANTAGAAASADNPPGVPPGVCASDGSWGPPLSGTVLSAARVQGGLNFLEGPVWVADPGFLLVSDLGQAAGFEQVQPSTIHRLAPPAAAETFYAASGSNGLALTPDGQQIIAATHDNRAVSAFRLSDRTLYVGAYGGNRIYAYQVRPDGSTGERTTFATIAGPDGATVDCAGNVYWVSNSQGRVYVFSPGGATLGTISSGSQATNAAFGGADRRTLYITAGRPGDYGIYTVRLGVPGYPY